MFSYNWSQMHAWLFFKKRIRLILICCNTHALDKSSVMTSSVNATNFKINLLICISNERRHSSSEHVFQKTTSTTISMHRWAKARMRRMIWASIRIKNYLWEISMFRTTKSKTLRNRNQNEKSKLRRKWLSSMNEISSKFRIIKNSNSNSMIIWNTMTRLCQHKKIFFVYIENWDKFFHSNVVMIFIIMLRWHSLASRCYQFEKTFTIKTRLFWSTRLCYYCLLISLYVLIVT